MKAGLMVPCYVDMFYPEVGIATVELLEKLKVDFEYPYDQTCCGQPMANSGCYEEAKATEELFIRLFHDYDYIIAPSGSCTHHIRNKFTAAAPTPERDAVSKKVIDLVEFLHDVLNVDKFPWAHFPHKVALHTSCSAIRGLGMASMSELVHQKPFSKPKALLERVDGVQFVEFDRHDECCGFGGTFSATEEAVSAKIGYDKLAYIEAQHPDCIVSSDMSCLMHLQGCARRMKQEKRFLHVVEILNGASL